MKHDTTMDERFDARVTVRGPDDCWLWTGARSRSGHGTLGIKGTKATIGAHRFAFARAHPDISIEGFEVCHACDNPPCCNPAHLFRGTHADNLADAANKNRFPYGSKNHATKLSSQKVAFILRSTLPCRTLAARYNVSFQVISLVRLGKRKGFPPNSNAMRNGESVLQWQARTGLPIS